MKRTRVLCSVLLSCLLCCLFAQKSFVFRDIELTLPRTGKVLIDKVTGTAKAGRVLALMGPSGVCVRVYDMTQLTRTPVAGRDCGGKV